LDRIIECVPNFSEGKDKGIIDQITSQVETVENVKLLNVEMDADYNRTVVTFVGTPDNVSEAAFRAARKAIELIDMTTHKGEHPRMGAIDVVPFIPVAGVSMDDCVAESKKFAEKLGNHGIPVYLYEYSATSPERRNLAKVRKGEYEALEEKLAKEEWKPDYGPAKFVPKAGGTVTGGRKFLIAYNVNLDTDDVPAAKTIAENIRESGKIVRDPDGNKVYGEDGKVKRIPGSLKAVKGMGFLLEAKNIAQISMNLVDFEVTPMHIAYEECKKEAMKLGRRVTGSEVVGVVPKKAMLMAGKHYIGEGTEDELISAAIEHMGLSDLETFEPGKKVIELML